MTSPAAPDDVAPEVVARSFVPPASTRNPASAVYGTVLASSMIAVDGGRDDVDIPHLVAVVLTTQCVYWLAHTYSELVGDRVVSGRRPGRGQVLHVLGDAWPLMSASFTPLVVVVLTWLLGARANTAVLAGLWAGIAVLAGWALFAGLRARLRPLELLLHVVLSGAFGTAILLLKIVLH